VATDLAGQTTARLLKRIVRTVCEHELFARGQHVLVAVSGGPDSTALLLLLAGLADSWHLTISAVHINYGLRGKESDEDESFVSTLCRKVGVRLVTRQAGLLKRRGQSSVQAAARDFRYKVMRDVAEDIGADRVAVGHTVDDQAETVLMWMLRGAGLTGLAGMPFVRNGLIVRPLLSISREEVLRFLTDEGVPYREDASNRSSRYLRNRIRMELVPLLRRLAPAAIENVVRQAELLRAEDQWLERETAEQSRAFIFPDQAAGHRIDPLKFRAAHVALQRRMIRRLWRLYDPQRRAPTSRVVETARRFLLRAKPGQGLTFRQVVLRRECDWIEVCPRLQVTEKVACAVQAGSPITVGVPSTVRWGGTDTQFHVQVMRKAAAASLLASPSLSRAVLDADRVAGALVVRGWQAGDRIAPSGMAGRRKKLQDLFTDLKIPRPARAAIPVIADDKGILWVAGVRQDERCRVREDTMRCLVITMSRISEPEGAQ